MSEIQQISSDDEKSGKINEVEHSEDHAGRLLTLVFEGIISNGMGDLTMRQMAIFLSVSNKDGLTLTEISKRFNISISSVSRSVDVLTTKGVLRRNRDGRFVQLFMTPKGKAVIGRAISSINKHL